MRAARRPPSRSVSRDIDEQTVVGEVYMRSLMRAQMRLALGVLVGFALTLCSLPLLFAVAPTLRTLQVLGIPLPWLVLGVLAYPLVGVAAWTYIRAAERAERDFADLVSRR